MSWFLACGVFLHRDLILSTHSATFPACGTLVASQKPATMTDLTIKNKIETTFSILLGMGFDYTYSESNGILQDRSLMKFDYDNSLSKKKVSIVYCIEKNNKRLHGFLINYSTLIPTIIDYENLIPFSRLKCMLNENETKFFGSEQFELDFQLKEFDLLIQRFQNELISESWIDVSEMESKEKSIYVFTRRHGNEWWINDVRKVLKKKKNLYIKYDYSVEMPYESYGIRIENKCGLEFHITHGYKTRDDTVFLVQIFKSGQEIDIVEFENTNAEKVFNYIEDMASH